MAGTHEPQTPKHSLIAPARHAADEEDFAGSLNCIERQFAPGLGFPSQISEYRDFSHPYPSPPEVFTTAIVAQCLLDVGAAAKVPTGCLEVTRNAFTADGLVHFFHDRELLDADLDCTAIAHSLCLGLGCRDPRLDRAVGLMLSNTNEAGVFEVYLRPRPGHCGRVDECVLVNVLYLLHQLGLAHDADASWQCVQRFLLSDAYLLGTRYYPSPDVFLYFLSRLVRDFSAPRETLLPPLRERLMARRGADTPCFDRALRVSACANVGLEAAEDVLVVASARRHDGSWATSPFFRYGKAERYFGSESLSTAVGAQALVNGASLPAERARPRSFRIPSGAATS